MSDAMSDELREDVRQTRGVCHGLGPDHCCYLEGEICPFLEMRTQEHRRWTCGLYREHRDWDLVHSDPRYLLNVRPVWERHGVRDCGDFGSEEGQCCWGQYEPSNELHDRTKCPPEGVTFIEREDFVKP